MGSVPAAYTGGQTGVWLHAVDERTRSERAVSCASVDDAVERARMMLRTSHERPVRVMLNGVMVLNEDALLAAIQAATSSVRRATRDG